MIGIFPALLIGIGFGVIAGLIPGIHPNTMIPLLAGLVFIFDPFTVAIILIASGVVNSFVSMIPAVLLGAPEDGEILSVLPGHRLLLEGRGYEAIKLTVVGSLGGMLFGLATLPVFAITIPPVYNFISPFVHILLLVVVSYMILTDKNKPIALFLVLISGALGFAVLNFSDNMIFPLLSGLFGLPLLILSVVTKSKLPKKFTYKENKIPNKTIFGCIATGSLAGILTGLLPGVGSAQATLIAQKFSKSGGEARDFLISIGAVTTANIIYSLLALWLIGKGRSGIAVAVGELVEINFITVLTFLGVIIVSSAVATVMTLKLTEPVLWLLRRVDYNKISLSIVVLIGALVVIFSGWIGLLVALVGIVIGSIPNYYEVRRSHCMGCLLIPVVIWMLL